MERNTKNCGFFYIILFTCFADGVCRRTVWAIALEKKGQHVSDSDQVPADYQPNNINYGCIRVINLSKPEPRVMTPPSQVSSQPTGLISMPTGLISMLTEVNLSPTPVINKCPNPPPVPKLMDVPVPMATAEVQEGIDQDIRQLGDGQNLPAVVNAW